MLRSVRSAAVALAMVAGLGSAAHAQTNYQRLTTEFLGGSMSMDVADTGRADLLRRTAMMLPTSNAQGQFWLLSPSGGGNFRMTTAWTGAGQCLDVGQGGVLYFDTCGPQIGQQWQVQRTAGGRVRIMNAFMPGHCLDVNNDPSAYVVLLRPCGPQIGQNWDVTDTGVSP
ncbi:MAG: ricin-type beta-trefoil lectin domain protein [Bradyrhizobium sp.]|uniref:ricin-type beta-trefoil lectin domain protein n=1 Tax=Bradyrhizobium sp. TaxID=376 RepID=UPI003D11DF66